MPSHEDDASPRGRVSARVLYPCACMGASSAQSAPRPPEFKVDPTWPTIPNNWVLGEVTSISVDRNDHIWVLHVPQSIPEAQRANAAPPVLEFDAAGKLLTSWGGPGDGVAVARARARHLRRRERLRLDRRARRLAAADHARRQRRHDPEVHDGRKARDADRPSAAQSKGNLDTENVHQATDVFVDTQAKEVYAADGYGNKRVIVFDSETGKFKRMWGAFGNPPPPTFAPNAADAAAADDARRPAGVRLAARDQGVARRRRLRRGSDQQPHPDVHARREVPQAGARDERRQRRSCRCRRASRSRPTRSSSSSTSSTPGRCAS